MFNLLASAPRPTGVGFARILSAFQIVLFTWTLGFLQTTTLIGGEPYNYLSDLPVKSSSTVFGRVHAGKAKRKQRPRFVIPPDLLELDPGVKALRALRNDLYRADRVKWKEVVLRNRSQLKADMNRDGVIVQAELALFLELRSYYRRLYAKIGDLSRADLLDALDKRIASRRNSPRLPYSAGSISSGRRSSGKPPTNSEIFNAIAESTGMTKKDANAVFDAIAKVIEQAMQAEAEKRGRQGAESEEEGRSGK